MIDQQTLEAQIRAVGMLLASEVEHSRERRELDASYRKLAELRALEAKLTERMEIVRFLKSYVDRMEADFYASRGQRDYLANPIRTVRLLIGDILSRE